MEILEVETNDQKEIKDQNKERVIQKNKKTSRNKIL